MSLWKSIKIKINKNMQLAGNKTVEMTKVGRIKIDVLALKKEIEEKLVELGGRVYHSYDDKNAIDLSSDKKIEQLIEQIKELEIELKNYEIAIEDVKGKKRNL
jgi:ABC-type phosphate transport system auxiliary subunit